MTAHEWTLTAFVILLDVLVGVWLGLALTT
jgi:hypothetical protein